MFSSLKEWTRPSLNAMIVLLAIFGLFNLVRFFTPLDGYYAPQAPDNYTVVKQLVEVVQTLNEERVVFRKKAAELYQENWSLQRQLDAVSPKTMVTPDSET